MKKTYREWFNELPPAIRDAAIKNTDIDLDENKSESMQYVIKSSFVWSSSPEGFAYWYDVYESVKEKKVI